MGSHEPSAPKVRVRTVVSRTLELAAPDRKVFRLVDGKLVRIQGDKRDPARRYRTVCSVESGETYLVEYTDGEERQANQQEAAWKAGELEREATRRREEEEAEKFRASLRYEGRVAAFLDVLGWRTAIERSTHDPKLVQDLGVALNTSMTASRLLEWLNKQDLPRAWPGNPQITHFSDSVFLSVLAGDHAEDHLAFYLHAIVGTLLGLGYLVRGGISQGPLIHKGSIAYGPALIAAYDLEHRCAKHPRVVLDDALAELWGGGTRVQDAHGRERGYINYWRRDEDGRYFFDYLQPSDLMPVAPSEELSRELLAERLAPVRSVIVDRLEEYHAAHDVREKYLWVARYFNSVCDEHSIQTISRIN